MVAFYIQNTKKILVSLLLFGILTSFKCSNLPNNCKEINNFLELELRFTMDTVKIGETVELNMIFRNKTDTTLQFYPKAVIHITKPFVAFGIDCAYLINDTLDITKIAEIKPRAVCIYTYNVLVNEKFFKIGENSLTLNYRCNELKGKDKVYNKLCGTLNSNEIRLIVLPK